MYTKGFLLLMFSYVLTHANPSKLPTLENGHHGSPQKWNRKLPKSSGAMDRARRAMDRLCFWSTWEPHILQRENRRLCPADNAIHGTSCMWRMAHPFIQMFPAITWIAGQLWCPSWHMLRCINSGPGLHSMAPFHGHINPSASSLGSVLYPHKCGFGSAADDPGWEAEYDGSWMVYVDAGALRAYAGVRLFVYWGYI